MVRQLGWDSGSLCAPPDRDGGRPGTPACSPFVPEADRPGPYAGPRQRQRVGCEKYADILGPRHGGRRVGRRVRVRPRLPARLCTRHPAAAPTTSPTCFWLELRASFPFGEARHRPPDRPGGPAHAASPPLCAGACGGATTDGAGSAPRPAPTSTSWALSHAEFGPRGLRREYVLYDEVAVWKQILLQTGGGRRYRCRRWRRRPHPPADTAPTAPTADNVRAISRSPTDDAN